jgi:hypothetical protein
MGQSGQISERKPICSLKRLVRDAIQTLLGEGDETGSAIWLALVLVMTSEPIANSRIAARRLIAKIIRAPKTTKRQKRSEPWPSGSFFFQIHVPAL